MTFFISIDSFKNFDNYSGLKDLTVFYISSKHHEDEEEVLNELYDYLKSLDRNPVKEGDCIKDVEGVLYKPVWCEVKTGVKIHPSSMKEYESFNTITNVDTFKFLCESLDFDKLKVEALNLINTIEEFLDNSSDYFTHCITKWNKDARKKFVEKLCYFLAFNSTGGIENFPTLAAIPKNVDLKETYVLKLFNLIESRSSQTTAIGILDRLGYAVHITLSKKPKNIKKESKDVPVKQNRTRFRSFHNISVSSIEF